MEALRALGCVALLLGAAAAFLLGRSVAQAAERRERLAEALAADGTSRWARLLRQGVPLFLPLARKLLERAPVRGAVDAVGELAASHGAEAAAAPLLSCMLAGLLAVGLGAAVVAGSALCGMAVACCGAIALVSYARTAQERRQLALREEVPEALRAMNVCFRSGLSLMQTLRQTAQEVGGRLGALFSTAAQRLEMGAPATEALAVLERQRGVPELAFAAVALDVQHQSGGSIGPVLEAAQDSVESELELLRSLKVQTAQAKLSARVVTVMPFIWVGLFSLMSPGFLSPFFESLPGMVMLAVALLMEAAGVLVVRRMLKVDL